jgi:hypothetical protein
LIAIAPYVDTRWIKFFEIADRTNLLEDERLATPELRLQNMSLMYQFAADIMPGKPRPNDWTCSRVLISQQCA